MPMTREDFVKNVEYYCTLRGVKPKTACRESGAGEDLMNNLRRGRSTSIEKAQLLAAYLGVTTSQLLGEEGPPGMPTGVSPADQELLAAYHRADAHTQQLVTLALEPYKEKETTTASSAG